VTQNRSRRLRRKGVRKKPQLGRENIKKILIERKKTPESRKYDNAGGREGYGEEKLSNSTGTDEGGKGNEGRATTDWLHNGDFQKGEDYHRRQGKRKSARKEEPPFLLLPGGNS